MRRGVAGMRGVGFDCIDCGVSVVAFGPAYAGPPPPEGRRCAVCGWIAEIADPAVREQTRATMRERGMIGE